MSIQQPTGPERCPCCEAALVTHAPETDDVYESWEYSCGLNLGRGDRSPFAVFDDCSNATESAVRKLNQQILESAST